MITKPKNELDNNVKILSKTAFTLIELLVVITMIITLTIGLSKIDMSKGQDIQKSLSFAQKIQLPIETAITNALIGKGIGNNLMVPNSWKIEISKANSGTITTNYFSGSSWIEYETIKSDKFYEISDIKCYDLDNIISETIIGTGTIYITGSTLGTSCSGSGRIIEINTRYKKMYPHKIRINSVSGIVEKN